MLFNKPDSSLFVLERTLSAPKDWFAKIFIELWCKKKNEIKNKKFNKSLKIDATKDRNSR